jgi:molecular chaperone GrpE
MPKDKKNKLDAAAPEISQEAMDYKESWQRALADLDNLQKRQAQEKQGYFQFALTDLMLELLPVVDNFRRAMAHIPADQASSSWVSGIQYIQKNLLDLLESKGVKEIPMQVGDQFVGENAEAIGTTIDDRLAEGSIASINAMGYTLNGKLLRPAQVVVVVAPDSGQPKNETKE